MDNNKQIYSDLVTGENCKDTSFIDFEKYQEDKKKEKVEDNYDVFKDKYPTRKMTFGKIKYV